MNPFLKRYIELGEVFDPAEVTVKNALRVNNSKIEEKKLFIRLEKESVKLEKVDFLDHGYFYEADFSMGSTPEYLLGYYYLQEAASQLPAQVLDVKPGEIVLDMASAPGSKTTQIAQYMQDKGVIIALDNNIHRLASVRNNLERLGIKNTILFKKDARFAFDLGIKFDKVLLDAPCSGNFCVEDGWFDKRDIFGIKAVSKIQKELLKAAIKVLKKDGVLVYSTCSLEPEENELALNWLLKKFDNIFLEETGLRVGQPGYTNVFGEELNPELSKTRRLWPHKTGTEGFFVAKIRKTG